MTPEPWRIRFVRPLSGLCFLALFLITQGGLAMAMQLTATAFTHKGSIPFKFTCKGADLSPELRWQGAPAGTASFALICDDPDAPVGVWDHWILYNIPGDVHELPEGASKTPPQGSVTGKNSWGRSDYGGPCPPSGTHRYFFKLYALDTELELPYGAVKDQVLEAIKGHVLEETELMGTFGK